MYLVNRNKSLQVFLLLFLVYCSLLVAFFPFVLMFICAIHNYRHRVHRHRRHGQLIVLKDDRPASPSATGRTSRRSSSAPMRSSRSKHDRSHLLLTTKRQDRQRLYALAWHVSSPPQHTPQVHSTSTSTHARTRSLAPLLCLQMRVNKRPTAAAVMLHRLAQHVLLLLVALFATYTCALYYESVRAFTCIYFRTARSAHSRRRRRRRWRPSRTMSPTRHLAYLLSRAADRRCLAVLACALIVAQDESTRSPSSTNRHLLPGPSCRWSAARLLV